MPTSKTDDTLQVLALEAIAIQNASNLCGLVQGWSRAVLTLREAMPTADTETINRHPISKLWAYKLYSLACVEPLDPVSTQEFGEAYLWCLNHSK